VNPEMVISSDIIAGFPNETDAEHEQTLKLLDAAQFDFIYSYAFSVRRGTKAAKMDDVLTDEIRGMRLREIQQYQMNIQGKIRSQMVGKTYRMLVDGQSEMKGQKKWKGRTSCNRIVHFAVDHEKNSQDFLWHWVDVKVVSSTALSSQGELIQDYKRL
jgi:tRNA-2-methylthio-N6-dimethylallyladenosine synthase